MTTDTLSRSVLEELGHDRYTVADLKSIEEFYQFVEREKQQIDCLILQAEPKLSQLANWLHGQATILPAVIVQANNDPLVDTSKTRSPSPGDSTFAYHTAEVLLSETQLDQLNRMIERAIAQFIDLSPVCRFTPKSEVDLTSDLTAQNFLMLQQRRLTDKLKERLGYLGVYYKRDPQNFLRHLPMAEKRKLINQLRESYREIVLRYFADDGSLNHRIDDFVNTAFFADISVSQVVEIHMELMDEFSKQLKLEGRSEDILLDYRLTLIDTIAHLCEMYRRSIPRES